MFNRALLVLGLTIVIMGCQSQAPSASISYINPGNFNYQNYYQTNMQGPRYAVIVVNNNGAVPVALQTVNFTPTPVTNNTISIVNRGTGTTDPYYGNYLQCVTSSSRGPGKTSILAPQQQCIIVVYAGVGDPAQAAISPDRANLTVATAIGGTSQTFSFTNTTYLFVGGDFTSIGGASIGRGSSIQPLIPTNATLFAQCPANGSACTNALNGATPYAGNDIHAIAADNAGNLYVGGWFSQIGNAVSPSGRNLIAKCTPSQDGAYCVDAFSDANGRIYDISFDNAGHRFYAGGTFNFIGGHGPTQGGNMLAQCTPGSDCIAVIDPGAMTGNSVGTIGAVSVDNSGDVYVGGTFFAIGTLTSGSPLFANCSIGSCTNVIPDSNDGPNHSIYAISVDPLSQNVYIGGAFTQIGGITPVSGGVLLAEYNPKNDTWSNGLGPNGTNYASGTEIDTIAPDDVGGNLYVGGVFAAIGNSPSSSTGYLLAKCSNNNSGSCSDALGSAGDPTRPVRAIAISNIMVVSAS